MEYGCWGIPSVASNVAPYAAFLKPGETGFVASTPKEWREYISLLIENESERKRIGKNVQRIVQEKYDQDKTIHMWPEAWQTIKEVAIEGRAPRVWPKLWGSTGRNDPCPCRDYPEGKPIKYKKHCYPAWG